MERPIRIALSVSLAGHALLLTIPLLHPQWLIPKDAPETLEVVYESELEHHELQRLQRQVAELSAPSNVPSGSAAPAPTIRIPDRPVGGFSPLAPGPGQGTGGPGGGLPGSSGGTSLSRTPVVDLTNLIDAAQGDPVLLSYFGAIREQIQRTADRQKWSIGKTAGGVVYVSFVLAPNGQISSPAVLANRSAQSESLQTIAVGIIRSATPFPPFPPSLTDASKTIVVPLEFLLSP